MRTSLTSIIFLLLLNGLLRTAVAFRPKARYAGGCALLDGALYCYGGAMYIAGQGHPTSLAEHFSLDLRHSFGIPESLSKWKSLNNLTSFLLEPNSYFSIVPQPSSQSYVISGGIGYNNGSSLINPTTVYNASTDTWTSVNTTGIIQRFGQTGVLQLDSGILFWGGLGGITTDTYSPKLLSPSFDEWSTMSTSAFPLGAYARVYGSATMGRDGRSIFYIGGQTVQSAVVNTTSTIVGQGLGTVSMNDILIYDTVDASWLVKQAIGPTPSPRTLHTAVLGLTDRVDLIFIVPDTDMVLIYGGLGINSSFPVKDYVYQLDTVQLLWTQIPLPVTSGAGPRYGHSAVLYGNSSMFILFGVNEAGIPTDDFYVLELEDMKWTDYFKSDWTPHYQERNPNLVPVPLSGGDKHTTLGGVFISCGTIIGIVATAIVLLAARRKNAKEDSLYASLNAADERDERDIRRQGAIRISPRNSTYTLARSYRTSLPTDISRPIDSPGIYNYDETMQSQGSSATVYESIGTPPKGKSRQSDD
ncbi:hypothetical protein J3Q64DRAFT_1844753 [Phycomyces blakesleeanus]|uniref:Galactose oxidase n=1 Tax=Phycomyces blakesleeanus TaxID=4837 RepID=A0ABR3BF08_PHYBL